jgi:hypothetical protein
VHDDVPEGAEGEEEGWAEGARPRAFSPASGAVSAASRSFKPCEEVTLGDCS